MVNTTLSNAWALGTMLWADSGVCSLGSCAGLGFMIMESKVSYIMLTMPSVSFSEELSLYEPYRCLMPTDQTCFLYLLNQIGVPHKDKKTTDRKSTRLNSSHQIISYAVFCLKKKKNKKQKQDKQRT